MNFYSSKQVRKWKILPFNIKQLCKDARFCSTSHYRNDLLIVKQICKATALQLQ
jgi:hypothetical protein